MYSSENLYILYNASSTRAHRLLGDLTSRLSAHVRRPQSAVHTLLLRDRASSHQTRRASRSAACLRRLYSIGHSISAYRLSFHSCAPCDLREEEAAVVASCTNTHTHTYKAGKRQRWRRSPRPIRRERDWPICSWRARVYATTSSGCILYIYARLALRNEWDREKREGDTRCIYARKRIWREKCTRARLSIRMGRSRDMSAAFFFYTYRANAPSRVTKWLLVGREIASMILWFLWFLGDI